MKKSVFLDRLPKNTRRLPQLQSDSDYITLVSMATRYLQTNAKYTDGHLDKDSKGGINFQRDRDAMDVDAVTHGAEQSKGGKTRKGNGTSDDWKKEAEC